MADFWKDVWQGMAKQRKIQAREERQSQKSSSSGGRSRGGRSRGYFSRSGRSGGKSLGMGRTSRISSSSYTHKTSVVVKKIQPNSSKYNNTRTIRNALNYIAGLSETSEQKNENVKLTYINGYDKTPTTTQENQKEFVENFYQNLKNEVNIPSQEQAEQNPRKNPPLVQHIVFSINANTTENGKEISREEIAQLQERAIIKLTQENEILKNHAILMARHDHQKGQEEEHTNGVHFHLIKNNFNTQTMELDKDFWSKEQIRNLQREFAQNCQKMGLDVKIPKEYEKDKSKEINQKQEQTENLGKNLHRVKSIEYYKNGKPKSLVLENLENGEIFQRNDKDIARFVSKNDIKIDDEFKVKLQIKKETNKMGKEYTTFQWETPTERTSQREREEEEKRKREQKEEKALQIMKSNFQELEEMIEEKTQEEDRYKDETDQEYEGHRSVALKIYRAKISKIPQTEEKQKEHIKQLDNEKLQNLVENSNFYINLTKEEKEKIYSERIKWKEEKKEAFFKMLDNKYNTPEQRKLQKEKLKEQEEKLQKKFLENKKIAIERLEKEIEPYKAEEDNYKNTTNQKYEGYKSIKVKIYENEIQNLSKNERGLYDADENTNYLYNAYSKRIQMYLKIKKEEIEKQEQDWDYEISQAEEQREKERQKQEQIKKPLEPKTQEQEQIKRPIEKPIEQEPKREFKPKPKKKDKGFSR